MLNRLKNLYWLLLTSTILLVDSLAYGDVAVVRSGSQSLAQVSTGLLEPLGLFTQALYNICYVIGAMMIFGAITQYREHRNNPAQTPISRPVMLLLLGLLLILLPIIGKLSAASSYLR